MVRNKRILSSEEWNDYVVDKNQNSCPSLFLTFFYSFLPSKYLRIHLRSE